MQRQAQWLLFLQDFDLAYQALPSTQMAPTNAPSHQNDVDTSLNNANVQLLPSNAFDQQIWAINVALADKIKDSSSSNLLALQAVHQMEKELPLFNRSWTKDWTFNNGWLYFKHCCWYFRKWMIRMLGNSSTFPLVPITLWAGDRQYIYQMKQVSSSLLSYLSELKI